jgi:hypothetical protein
MHLNIERQIQLGDTLQALAQNFLLDLKLVFVAGVLVVASSAARKILAARQNAVWRRLNDRVHLGSCEARLLLGELSLDLFSRQHERYKDGLTASLGFITGRIDGETSQSVAAVDHLFNCEEQDFDSTA